MSRSKRSQKLFNWNNNRGVVVGQTPILTRGGPTQIGGSDMKI